MSCRCRESSNRPFKSCSRSRPVRTKSGWTSGPKLPCGAWSRSCTRCVRISSPTPCATRTTAARSRSRGPTWATRFDFLVRDSGVGIAAEHIDRLTERFYRVDLAGSRSRGGTGLGLAIVKHVLRRHGSELGIESVLGEGSLFFCDFEPAANDANQRDLSQQTLPQQKERA